MRIGRLEDTTGTLIFEKPSEESVYHVYGCGNVNNQNYFSTSNNITSCSTIASTGVFILVSMLK